MRGVGRLTLVLMGVALGIALFKHHAHWLAVDGDYVGKVGSVRPSR